MYIGLSIGSSILTFQWARHFKIYNSEMGSHQVLVMSLTKKLSKSIGDSLIKILYKDQKSGPHMYIIRRTSPKTKAE